MGSTHNRLVRLEIEGTRAILFNQMTSRARTQLEVGGRGKKLGREEQHAECGEKLHRAHGAGSDSPFGIPVKMLWAALVEGGRQVPYGSSTSKARLSTASGTKLGDVVDILDEFWPIAPQEFSVAEDIGNNQNAGGAGGVAMPVYRPRVEAGWKIVLDMRVNTREVQEEVVRDTLLGTAGMMIGLGSNRAANGGLFGTFRVASWKAVMLPNDLTDRAKLREIASNIDWERVEEQIQVPHYDMKDLGLPLTDGTGNFAQATAGKARKTAPAATTSDDSADTKTASSITLPIGLEELKGIVAKTYGLERVRTSRVEAFLDEQIGAGRWILGDDDIVRSTESVETSSSDDDVNADAGDNGSGNPDPASPDALA